MSGVCGVHNDGVFLEWEKQAREQEEVRLIDTAILFGLPVAKETWKG